jgi:hypothetical protein
VRESGARENGIMERDLEAELRLAMGSRHLANKRIDELESALRYIADHASEAYPHFEDTRGQADIANARAAILKAEGGDK